MIKLKMNKEELIISHIKKRYILYKHIPYSDIKKIKKRYSLSIITSFLKKEIERINNEIT